jgi:biopolymer transport protein ExbD
MAVASQEADDEITAINVTPLVDIVLVLLIVFMVTATFIVRETMEVDLPRAANAGETVEGLINVVMDKEGRIFLDGSQVGEEELVRKAKESVSTQPQTRAIVSADQSVSYGRLIHVIDTLKGQGVNQFALNIEKETAAQPQR